MRSTYSTRPREAIAAVLRDERRYLSAAEIHRRLQQRRAKVSLSTVYRTLDLLKSKGDVDARVDEQGEATYVACEPTHHHHAICRVCGKVEEVDCEAIERFRSALRGAHDFELDAHDMAFYGRCAACR